MSIGKAVEARIRAASLSQRHFTISRSYGTWDIELKSLEGLALQESEKLRIDVVTHTLSQQIDHRARNSIKFVVPVDVAVRKKFGNDQIDQATGDIHTSAIDEMMLLQQEIHLLFAGQLLADFPCGAWDQEAGGTEVIFGPLKAHLREMNQFTGLLRIYFRVSLPIVAREE